MFQLLGAICYQSSISHERRTLLSRSKVLGCSSDLRADFGFLQLWMITTGALWMERLFPYPSLQALLLPLCHLITLCGIVALAISIMMLFIRWSSQVL